MTTPTLREAAEAALDTLDRYEAESAVADTLRAALAKDGRDWSLLAATQESLREHMAELRSCRAALAQPVPDAIHWPQVVAYPGGNGGLGAWVDISTGDGPEHVQRFHAAAHPQPAPLTDAQIWEIGNTTLGQQGGWNVTFARAIEAAHGIVPAPTTDKEQ
jgi:hypothetical protein